MAENRVRGPVVGIALDGTGYGTDGQIWGGEILVCDLAQFERRAHFRYVPLAGGDAAVRQPWRSALAHLRDAFGEEAAGLPLPLHRAIPQSSVRVVWSMMERGVQTVQTSSCGRLFDAAASIAGLCHENTYEAQAAIEWESLCGEPAEPYRFAIERGEIDFRECIRDLVHDVRSGQPVPGIAARFHATVAAAVVQCAAATARAEGLKDICLSGGSFQNGLLFEAVLRGLAGFRVHTHSRIPANDGGLSLGQAVIANAVLQRRGGN
jgi:hydrogenase maturation protein HypF